MRFYPLYCPACQTLTFLRPVHGENETWLFEYDKAGLKAHACAQLALFKLEANEQVRFLSKLAAPSDRLPFKHRGGNKQTASELMPLGLVLGATEKQEGGKVDLLMPDNRVVVIKPSFDPKLLLPGIFIKTHKAKRLTKGNYRLNELEVFDPEQGLDLEPWSRQGVIRIELKADELEILEKFTHRFLEFVTLKGAYPLNLSLLTLEDSEPRFARRIEVAVAANLLEKLDGFFVPETITFSAVPVLD